MEGLNANVGSVEATPAEEATPTPAVQEQPATPAPSAAAKGAVEPIGWNCPENHPIKGNIRKTTRERIYHLPGGQFYDATNAERCFATEADAQAEGYRLSER